MIGSLLLKFRSYQTMIGLGLVLLITAMVFSPCLKHELLSNDDNLHIYDNPSIRSLDSAHLKEIFTRLFNPTYIPLTQLSFAIEYHFVKDRPWLYHFNNLLLHLAVTSLVFGFALRIGLSPLTAFIAALLFGIHPMHVESVAWVTERKDVLYSFFYLLAMWGYWKYLEKRELKIYLLTMVCGVLSILAKPMALSLPLILWLLDYYKGRKWNVSMLLDKIPHFLYIIPIALMTYLVNARNPVSHGGEAILLWVWCFVFYFCKFIFPFQLVLFYRFPQPITLLNSEYVLSMLSFVLIIVSLWIFRRHRLFVFSVGFMFLSLFFLLRFDDIKYLPPVSNRFLYLPSLGFCFFVGYGVELFYRWAQARQILRILGTTLIVSVTVGLGLATFAQTQIWRSNITFWSYELKYFPDNAMALVNRGEAYRDQGDLQLAFADFQKAVLADPNYPEAYNSRGLMLGMSGQLDAALRDFQKVIALKPNFDEAYNNLGIIYAMKNDLGKAVEYFQKTLAIDPRNVEGLFNLGCIYYDQQKFSEALKYFQKVLALTPDHLSALQKRGVILATQKKYDLALRDFNTALQIDRRNPELYCHRAIVYEQKRMPREALANYNTAIRLAPRYVDAYYGRGNVFASLGQLVQAQKDFEQALALNPKHVGALRSHARLLEELKKKVPANLSKP